MPPQTHRHSEVRSVSFYDLSISLHVSIRWHEPVGLSFRMKRLILESKKIRWLFYTWSTATCASNDRSSSIGPVECLCDPRRRKLTEYRWGQDEVFILYLELELISNRQLESERVSLKQISHLQCCLNFRVGDHIDLCNSIIEIGYHS